MFLSPAFIRHGIVALREEIARQQRLWKECGDEWPDDFDPSDIPLFEIVLADFLRNALHGHEEIRLNSKPLIFFFRLLPRYVRDRGARLAEPERTELLALLDTMYLSVPHAQL
jgi:hypothetical protein